MGFAKEVCTRCDALFSSRYNLFLKRLDAISPNQRRALAVIISAMLHLGILLLTLSSQKGFLSIGTTGLGDSNGAGTAVTLVDATEIEPPHATPETTSPEERTEATEAETETETDVSEADVKVTSVEAETYNKAKAAAKETPLQPFGSQPLPESTSPAFAGAFGQNGEAYTDLWNAIAPCWNRIADIKTLPAKLTISFDGGGGLSTPPVIERNPDGEITDESLHAEAKALQALSECGAYPMAKDLQNVIVRFPPLWQDAASVQPTSQTSLPIRP